MFKGLVSGLSSRVQPVLKNSKAVFRSTTATYTNKQTNTAIKTSMADNVFVLKEYNNVPVTAQGLERDQLTQWAPFKVSTRAENITNSLTSTVPLRRASERLTQQHHTELDLDSLPFPIASNPAFAPLP